mmetsp:Transcript_50075/g.91815  ORF Transcript_50075/g.91815 Transcript_50075/m.91815 type:complete len:90 (+) Transcript_50075:1-270(+)
MPFATANMIDRFSLPFLASDVHTQQKCVICQEHFVVDEKLRRLPCLHIFHAACVCQHLAAVKSCPACRMNIDTDADKCISSTSPASEPQ